MPNLLELGNEPLAAHRTLLRDIDAAALLSVDIFDTLLIRTTAHPHDVFLEVGRRAVAGGLLPTGLPPEQIRSMRVDAERRARAGKADGGTEVTLAEIWQAMLSSNPATIDALVDLEVEVEAETCRRNPAVVPLVERARERGIPIVLVSDMYLLPHQIHRILARAGWQADDFDGLFVSSEGRGAKWDGRLFAEVRRRFPRVPPADILHIGDNCRSDVEQARLAGVRARHTPFASSAAETIERLEQRRHGRVTPELHALRRVAVSFGDGEAAPQRWWFDLGAIVLGPFLSAFSDWVVAHCAAEGVVTVRTLTREGYLLGRLIDRVARKRGTQIQVAPLHASRAAVWLAGHDRFDDHAVNELCSLPHLDVQQALALLGIDRMPEELQPHAAVALLPAIASSASRNAVDVLRRYLGKPHIQESIERRRSRRRTLLARHLEASCGHDGEVAIVDFGFHATTGRALERIATSRIALRCRHFLALGAESIEHAGPQSGGVRPFAGGPGVHLELVPALIRRAAVLEALLVTGGTTTGYVETPDGRVVPAIEPAEWRAAQDATIAACHRGIAAFQHVWLESSVSPGSPARDPQRLCEQLHRLVDCPSAQEAERIGALMHEHNGGGCVREMLIDDSGLWPEAAAARAQGDAEAEPARPGVEPRLPLVALARRVRDAGVRACLVYGGGDAGRQLAAALRDEGVAIDAFVDRNPSLWGTRINGVPIASPEHARNGSCHVYAIGSIAFADQIGADLAHHYSGREQLLQIFAASLNQEQHRLG